MNDIVRSCSWCEREFGVRIPGKNVSHGLCKRHFINQMKTAGISGKDLTKFENRPESDFSPDLSEFPEYVKDLKNSGHTYIPQKF